MSFVVDQLGLLGLNKREIIVFTTLSTFGQMTVTKLAGRSGLPRTTVDAIVRRLGEHGLVTREKVKKHWEWSVDLEDVTKKLSFLNEKLVPEQKGAELSGVAIKAETLSQLKTLIENENTNQLQYYSHTDLTNQFKSEIEKSAFEKGIDIAWHGFGSEFDLVMLGTRLILCNLQNNTIKVVDDADIANLFQSVLPKSLEQNRE